jgi:ABC-type glycerol-3-phosphate transport system substrate-binding protein
MVMLMLLVLLLLVVATAALNASAAPASTSLIGALHDDLLSSSRIKEGAISELIPQFQQHFNVLVRHQTNMEPTSRDDD